MTKKKTPFLERDYTYNEKYNLYFPILEILVGSKEYKKKISALADTGCTSCIHLCKSFVEKEKLVLGKKINKEPIPFSVADGHTINGDFYEIICEIDGKEEKVIVSVIDPEKFFKEEEPQIETVEPLLGRGILDKFDVLFKGKERKIALSHPE